MRKRRSKVAILIAVFLMVLIPLAIGEVFVRLAAPQILYTRYNPLHPEYELRNEQFDGSLGWVPIPNRTWQTYTLQGRHELIQISHNAQGFRMDHEVDPRKDIVVVTGDSFAYGFWVDDAKTSSARLNALLGEDTEVVNLGVGGYGTDQSFLRYVHNGSVFKPKVVVHLMFPNDFWNNMDKIQHQKRKPYFLYRNSSLYLSAPLVELSPVGFNDLETSHAYGWLERQLRSGSHLYVLVANALAREPPASDLVPTDGEYMSILPRYDSVMEEAFELNMAILVAYHKAVEAHNGTFLLVLVPSKMGVDQKEQRRVERRYGLQSGLLDYEKPYRLMEQAARRVGIETINLAPRFKEDSEGLYLEDGHLSDAGNELVAEEIYAHMSGSLE